MPERSNSRTKSAGAASNSRLGGALRLGVAVVSVGSLGVACSSIIGFESEYEVVVPEDGGSTVGPGSGGVINQGGEGGENASGGSGGGTGCAHSPCVGGMALESGCDPCVTTVCLTDQICCDPTKAWDGFCVQTAQSVCEMDCCGEGLCLGTANNCSACPEDCGTCNCAHTVCEQGEPLDATSCAACTDEVCAQMPGCCGAAFSWTKDCYDLATAICPPDPCVTAVCQMEPSCCNTGWDASCVNLATTECNAECDCVHTPCTAGENLASGCDPCVTAVCKVDGFCCNNLWDPFCVAEVATICDIQC